MSVPTDVPPAVPGPAPVNDPARTPLVAPLSPETVGFFKRVLPQSILGLASLLFFMSIAAAFSGALLFAYYRFELDELARNLADIESSIADDVLAAEQIIEENKEEAIAEIERQLGELEQFVESSLTLEELLDQLGPSLYLVRTLDVDGQPSVGTAFVLFSDSERSFLLTSYATVEAATVSPGPGIVVSQRGVPLGAQLHRWDESRDLALLVAEDAPNLPPIELGDPSSVRPGDRIFSVSALGASGGSIVQGAVADAAANAIQHDAPIGVQFQGGPMVNSRGQLVAVASRRFAPLGFVPDAVYFGVPLREVCAEVVDCPPSLGG